VALRVTGLLNLYRGALSNRHHALLKAAGRKKISLMGWKWRTVGAQEKTVRRPCVAEKDTKMAKSHDAKKNAKKKPLKTMQQKKAAKKAKKLAK
jgi:hypothetical protein